jgi:hypothetical protein
MGAKVAGEVRARLMASATSFSTTVEKVPFRSGLAPGTEEGRVISVDSTAFFGDKLPNSASEKLCSTDTAPKAPSRQSNASHRAKLPSLAFDCTSDSNAFQMV